MVLNREILCIFSWGGGGGRMPVILRQQEGPGTDHYHFLGECYVHGLMFGEGLELLRSRGSDLKSSALV